MAVMRRRDSAFMMLGMTAAVLLAGCATGPAPLQDDQIDAVTDAYDPQDLGSLTVGDTLPLAPEGTIGVLDASESHEEPVIVDPDLHASVADWPVIMLCASPASVPSVLAVALPPGELASFEERAWPIECDLTQVIAR